MKQYLVKLMNDRGIREEVLAVINSDETISELLGHSHILEVIKEVDGFRIPKEGFLKVEPEEVEEVKEEEIKIEKKK